MNLTVPGFNIWEQLSISRLIIDETALLLGFSNVF